MDEDSRTCQICTVEKAKYVCPRCGLPYCSLKCYKDESKHLKCSESFYKDCVMDDLRAQETKDPEGAKKMAQTLQRFREEYEEGDDEGEMDDDDGVDSDDDEPLEKRLEGINLDDADEIWLNLTEEERAEFQKFAKEVDVNEIVPEWVPWWTIEPEKKKLVEEMSSDKPSGSQTEKGTKASQKVHKEQPDILERIPLMSSLTKVKPNDHVKRGLANVIASYVWTVRLYNGEFLTYESPEEIASALIELSSFLGKDTVFTTFEHAVADVSLNACQNPDLYDGGPGLQSSLSKDVFTILSGPAMPKPCPKDWNKRVYILSALTECYSLLSKTQTKFKSRQNANTKSKLESTLKESWVEELPLDSDNPSKSKNKSRPSTSLKQPSNQNKNCDSDDDDLEDMVSFRKTFKNPSGLSYIDPKLLTKAKRKVHYLLAFANEFDIL